MGFWLPSGRVYDFVPSVRLAKLKNLVFSLGHPYEDYRLSKKFVFLQRLALWGSPNSKTPFSRSIIPSGFLKGKNIFSWRKD